MITKKQLEESRKYASTMDKQALDVFEILVTQGHRNVPTVQDLKYLEDVIKAVKKVYKIEEYSPNETFIQGSYGDMVDQEIQRLMNNPNA